MIDGVSNPKGATSTEIIGVPIGTLDEILSQGLDPELVACCHAPSADGSIRGCPVWKSCLFNRRDMGGFKGEGPHYIGYYLQTARADKGHVVEGVMSCYNFTRVFLGRMLFGRGQRDAGKDHELIRVIAQEIPPGTTPSKAEIEKRHTVYVRRWERNAADGGNRSGDITMKTWVEPMIVPSFPRPHDNPGITYEDILRKREGERSAAESEEDDLRFERMRAVTTALADPDGGDEETTLELGDQTLKPAGGERLAGPVKKDDAE